VDDAVAITGNLRTAVTAYADPALAKDIAGSVKSLRGILEEVQQGNGAVHALVFDKRTGDEVKGLVRSATQTTDRIDVAMGHVEDILREVRSGKGGVHALIYERRGAQAIEEVGAAAEEIAALVRDAKRSQNGAIHQLVYGDARGMFADLGSAAQDLKKITGTIARGEGTLGAIIQDPTVYEDIKTILGNVKRNRVLRSLVRLTISNGEDLDQVGKPEGPVRPEERKRP
jgi:phospholipid/cholesterol/gamma-HCH transport system substrate-binding protein